MKIADNSEMLKKVYEFTDKITPLSYDCGRLCDAKCCIGSDNDGMLLLPGEEKLFADKEGFTVYFDERYSSYAVRCKGFCNRNERPFACRIFPFMIYGEKESGKTTVAPDIRALDFCPILTEKAEAQRKFLRALRISARYLSQSEEMLQYICRISEILTDFNCLDL